MIRVPCLSHLRSDARRAYVYLVGGRGDAQGSQTASVWSINPRTGAVRRAGRLPEPLSDTGVVSIGGALIVAGGLSSTSTQAGVGELVPSHTR